MPNLPELSQTITLNAGIRDEARLQDLLFAHVPGQDVNAYLPQEMVRSALLAKQALFEHRQGECFIHVDHEQVTRAGMKLSVLTLINDNRPFLLDSVMAELGEHIGQLYLVAHPVLDVSVDSQKREMKISIETAGPQVLTGTRRVSLMQFHVSALGAAQTAQLQLRLQQVLLQGEAAVRDWRAMLAHIGKLTRYYRTQLPRSRKQDGVQVADFLKWLCDDNFIFLGVREYVLSQSPSEDGDQPQLRPEGAELGILCNGSEEAMPWDVQAFLRSDDILLITKARALSPVHRRAWLDYVGIKLFDDLGNLSGEVRLVGLFASTAYTDSVMRIPCLAPKAEAVINRLGFNPQGHSGRMLVDELEIYPRDEMFRIDVDSLTRNAEQILALGERPRIRVLANAESFGHFVTVLVFIPRDRYDSDVREKIGRYLVNSYQADFFEFFPFFLKNGLTRVRYTLHRRGGVVPAIAQATLEETVADIIRNWQDKVQMEADLHHINPDIAALAACFPDAYRDVFDVATALQDAVYIHELCEHNPLHVVFYHHDVTQKHVVSLKLFHRRQALELSNRVPLLENMGFRVIAEQTFELPDGQGGYVYLHDMELENAKGLDVDLTQKGAERLGQAFAAIWSGLSYDDAFNLLVQSAGFDWYQVVMIRTFGRYLQQAGVPYSQSALARALDRYPAITRNLYTLFALKFNAEEEGIQKEEKVETAIERALADVPSLEDDRILRSFRTLIHAALRTNAFKLQAQGRTEEAIAIKFDPRQIDFLPRPVPYREIFVYGPQVQGVHLRFGSVARGGIRWSDRGQDYRTEVLGLVKAQQVKNAVIVPVGAKGGFFPHNLPADGDRAQVGEAARQAYISYVTAMLSITDNIIDNQIVPPVGLRCHDGNDAYFVVAADKGTATFSDTANIISQSHDFWLDDAFASGGSAGYDHKAMAITARGAWEAVKRHFREFGHDIQTLPFSCVGVGDMSGDVFGNAMLLSEKTRLIAAFDHRDIFIDPDPDPALSHAERLRLFNMARSGWQDYDRDKLSAGGEIFSRSLKIIHLSPAARAAIGFDEEQGTPLRIISAILKAQVDLLWFGGIGTYVRAKGETDAQVGDHANDVIRITGGEIGARVVGEGANLGMTQRGRIEYALAGGRCNTDAIDNSAGVNCSDVEVNIKIALAAANVKGKIDRPARDRLLKKMTDDVARLVLRNNYVQTQALSLAEKRAVADLPYQIRFMHDLERRGLLDRLVEALPDDQQLSERQSLGQGLTRPELCVLMAYAKITLAAELATGQLSQDSYFDRMLFDYFPSAMQQDFADEIASHPLRCDIITTLVANDIVNRGGSTFVNRLIDKTGQSVEAIVRSYIVLRDGFDVEKLYEAIDGMDNKISGAVQNMLAGAISQMLFRTTGWMLRNRDVNACLGEQVARLQAARADLEGRIDALMSPSMRKMMARQAASYEAQGAPADMARKFSLLEAAVILPDIMLLAEQGSASLEHTARCYFHLSEHIGVNRLEEASHVIPVVDYYDGLALAQANDQIGECLRQMLLHILRKFGEQENPVQNWLEETAHISEAVERMQALTRGDITLSRFIVAAGMMRDLARN